MVGVWEGGRLFPIVYVINRAYWLEAIDRWMEESRHRNVKWKVLFKAQLLIESTPIYSILHAVSSWRH